MIVCSKDELSTAVSLANISSGWDLVPDSVYVQLMHLHFRLKALDVGHPKDVEHLALCRRSITIPFDTCLPSKRVKALT